MFQSRFRFQSEISLPPLAIGRQTSQISKFTSTNRLRILLATCTSLSFEVRTCYDKSLSYSILKLTACQRNLASAFSSGTTTSSFDHSPTTSFLPLSFFHFFSSLFKITLFQLSHSCLSVTADLHNLDIEILVTSFSPASH